MATGDAAAAAGMAVVDGATTQANTIDTEINLTRDYIANGAGAVAAATANKVVKRDGNGRASIATPTSAGHIATKGYVDTTVSAAVADIDDYLPLSDVMVSTSGAAVAGKVPRYDASGRIVAGTPVAPNQAASKAYVDSKTSTASTVEFGSGIIVQGNADINGRAYFFDTPPATSSYAVAYLNGDGRLSRGASSERYKKDINAIDPGELGDIWPDLTRYQMRHGDGSWKYGYIAERLHENDDQRPFVVYTEIDGELVPDSIDFIALLMAQNAQLHQAVDLLAQRLDALEVNL